ncbi:MAG: adenylate/guanylate cyclase domain-containing protein [Leptospirales bacterium]
MNEEILISILVVDDEPDLEPLVLQTFRSEIKEKKYEFFFASDGAEALSILEEYPEICLVLTDINMPVMDGLTLLKKINELHENNKNGGIRKVIIVSAYGDMENIRAAMNERAYDFLTKPIDLKDLKVTVEKTLDEIEKINSHILEKKKYQMEKESLSRYFSSDIVEKILKEDFHQKMIGGNETASILFLDIRGFTTISETLKPDKVADLLNRIYPDFMELILSHKGSVNKLIGDAMVATFGLPIATADDAYNAVKTAIEIIKWVEMFSKIKPDYLGDQEIKIGIGITTGEVFAGNIGSFRRLEYTVIGDVVNTASRLQNLTKKVGVDILIDGETKKHLGDLVTTRKVRVKSIRGKKERIEIFTVDDLVSKESDDVDYF